MVSRTGLVQHLNSRIENPASFLREVGGLSLHGHRMAADAPGPCLPLRLEEGRRDGFKDICPFFYQKSPEEVST